MKRQNSTPQASEWDDHDIRYGKFERNQAVFYAYFI